MVVWQGITSGGTAVPVQVTESGEVVAATNTPVPGPEGPPGPDGPPGADGKDGAPGKDGDQWNELNSRMIIPSTNKGITVLLDSSFKANLEIGDNAISLGSDGSLAAAYLLTGDGQPGNGVNIGCRVGAFTFTATGEASGTRVWATYIKGNSSRTSQILANGNANFKITRFENLVIELDRDNPANYISTLMPDGETEPVYNGPTLDVKETLLKLILEVEAIKTRIASTGSVPED